MVSVAEPNYDLGPIPLDRSGSATNRSTWADTWLPNPTGMFGP